VVWGVRTTPKTPPPLKEQQAVAEQLTEATVTPADTSEVVRTAMEATALMEPPPAQAPSQTSKMLGVMLCRRPILDKQHAKLCQACTCCGAVQLGSSS
jgi:hypothetical protein